MLCKLRAGVLAILCLPNQPQRDTEANLRKESAILSICDSPDLFRSQFPWRELGPQSGSPGFRLLTQLTSPRILGLRPDFSKNLTASSPVTTPSLSLSAA